MSIELPFTVDDFLIAANERYAFALPENAPKERDKPRVSGICRDAREIAYMMANTPKTDANVDVRSDSVLTTEQGRMAEGLVIPVINKLGFNVLYKQRALPDSYPLTGHPDGMLGNPVPPEGLNIRYDPEKGWNAATRLEDGLVWGFESKHFGRWGYEDILKKGLEESSPETIAQVALYGDALGWDAALVVVTSQDASSVRSDMTRNRQAKNPAVRWADRPGLNPKVALFAVDIRPLKETLVPVLLDRAEWFIRWKEQDGDPANVMWEIQPSDEFPWGWAEWKTQALLDGQGTETAPRLPWS